MPFCTLQVLQSFHTYGYNISTPGFADEAIAALEKIGCVRAREHYNALVQE